MKRLLAVLMAALLVFGLAACGAGGGTSSTPPASTPAPAGSTQPDSTPEPPAEKQYSQGASDDKIIIANSAATSGGFGVVGVPFIAGIQAYLDMVNAGGGIDGRTIEFVHYTDDEGDAAKGKAAVEGIVEDLEAFAVVGHLGTPVVAATLGDLKDYGIPAVYFATGIGQLYANEAKTNADGYNIFPVQPVYTTEGRILTAFAAGHFGAKKIGVIYTNDDAGMDLMRGIEEQIGLMSGLELVSEQVTAGSADVSAAVTSIKNADVDFIVVASIQGTFPTIVKELAAQGVNKDCITSYVNTDPTMSAAVVGDIADKFDVYSTGWVDITAEEGAAYAEFAQWVAADYAANSFAMAGWIAAAAFCDGLRRIEGQDITWENYMNALEQGPLNLPFGAQVDFSNGNRWGTQSMYLNRAVPASEEFILGFEPITEMTNINDLY